MKCLDVSNFLTSGHLWCAVLAAAEKKIMPNLWYVMTAKGVWLVSKQCTVYGKGAKRVLSSEKVWLIRQIFDDFDETFLYLSLIFWSLLFHSHKKE